LSSRAVFDALGDPTAVLAHAQSLANAGQTQLALHVTDLLAGADAQHPVVAAARELKASLCEERSLQCSSVVSRQILRSCAEDLRGQPIGATRAQDPPSDFSWD